MVPEQGPIHDDWINKSGSTNVTCCRFISKFEIIVPINFYDLTGRRGSISNYLINGCCLTCGSRPGKDNHGLAWNAIDTLDGRAVLFL